MTGDAYTYSFGCPKCGGSWKFEEFAAVAKDVFSSFQGVGVCPRCGVTFRWRKPGEITTAPAWYEGKPHYKTHPCKWCGRTIDGKRRFCNVQCNKKWYYRKVHPAVKRKTPIVSPGTENKKTR